MTDELVDRILNDADYDPEREDSLRRFAAGVFERSIRTFTVLVVIALGIFIPLAVWAAVMFFRSETVWSIVLYATVFTNAIIVVAAVRIFMWQLLHRQRVLREIKRVDLRVARLAQMLVQTRQDG